MTDKTEKPFIDPISNPTFRINTVTVAIELESVDPETIPGGGGFPDPLHAVRRAVVSAIAPYMFLNIRSVNISVTPRD